MFIDTNIFVAARNKRDFNHRRAILLLRKALGGDYGSLYTSDYVFDEAVTVALIRTRRLEVAVDIGEFILSSKKLKYSTWMKRYLGEHGVYSEHFPGRL